MLIEAIVSDLYLVGIRLAIDARGVHLDDHIFTSRVHLGLGDVQEGVGIVRVGLDGVGQERVFLVA